MRVVTIDEYSKKRIIGELLATGAFVVATQENVDSNVPATHLIFVPSNAVLNKHDSINGAIGALDREGKRIYKHFRANSNNNVKPVFPDFVSLEVVCFTVSADNATCRGLELITRRALCIPPETFY